MNIAFLFPGQGSQVVGMGRELVNLYPVAQETFDEADEALGFKLSQLCFEGPENQLKLTENTQPAILTVSVATARVLQEKGFTPRFTAGHSLGEYSAHVAAGTLDFQDAVRTVRNRGKYMQEAVPVGQGAMAAILGLAAERVQDACNEISDHGVCQPANINSPEQVVISGSAPLVERAGQLCKDMGAKRAIMLPVSAPFHCALMQPARDRLSPDLQAIKFFESDCPVVCNVDAEPVTHTDAARDALIRQVTGTVQWVRCIQKLVNLGAAMFVEVGPGKVLSGLMRQIDRSKLTMNVEDEASLQKVVNYLEQQQAGVA